MGSFYTVVVWSKGQTRVRQHGRGSDRRAHLKADLAAARRVYAGAEIVPWEYQDRTIAEVLAVVAERWPYEDASDARDEAYRKLRDVHERRDATEEERRQAAEAFDEAQRRVDATPQGAVEARRRLEVLAFAAALGSGRT